MAPESVVSLHHSKLVWATLSERLLRLIWVKIPALDEAAEAAGRCAVRDKDQVLGVGRDDDGRRTHGAGSTFIAQSYRMLCPICGAIPN